MYSPDLTYGCPAEQACSRPADSVFDGPLMPALKTDSETMLLHQCFSYSIWTQRPITSTEAITMLQQFLDCQNVPEVNYAKLVQ